jgi:hypothetical protein
MKKLLTIIALAILVLSVMPAVFAVSVGSGITPDIETEDFAPLVWMCDNRVVYDDSTEPGRLFHDAPGNCQDLNGDGNLDCPLYERINNYAFEGEEIEWVVLVMDKNGINKVQDVFATIGDTQGAGNDIEVNCVELPGFSTIVEPSCNARILEEDLTGESLNTATQRYYRCTLIIETTESMYGEYWITVEAVDLDELSGTMAENEFWFLNPVISLSIDGDMTFENVRPGATSYSTTMTVGNDADDSSGVMLDMFISGTDFYDSSSSGTMCPTSNKLSLANFRYFATNGAYSTIGDDQVDVAPSRGDRNIDTEGYVNIGYGIGFNNPDPFYDGFEIIQDQPVGPYWTANILAPGAEMAITFKLNLPEPCNGDFDTGSIYFWGEAI